MFETTYLQIAKACDQNRIDIHEHALVTQTKSHDNQGDEDYDRSDENDFVSAEEIEKKDKEISNLSEIVAKQYGTIAQLTSEMKKLKSENESEKDVKSSYGQMPKDVVMNVCSNYVIDLKCHTKCPLL